MEREGSKGLGLSWRRGLPPAWQPVGLSGRRVLTVTFLGPGPAELGALGLRCPCRSKRRRQMSISVSREAEDGEGHVNNFLATKRILAGQRSKALMGK